MSNIKYNEKEEAFELPYKIWGEPKLVRFYAEDEQSIMDNLKDIAGKLAKLDGSRKKLAELIIDDGHFDYAEPDTLADTLELSNIYVDIDEDDTDAQKAAHWAVEQDLMQDDEDDNEFHPHFPVSKLRTCLTWNAAKEKGLFDNNKTAE